MAETRVCSTVSQNVLDLWAAKRTHQRAYIRLVTHRRPVAGKLVMGILALIAEFENDIRRERQMDGIAKAHERGVRFGRKRELTDEAITEIKALGRRQHRSRYHAREGTEQEQRLSRSQPSGLTTPTSSVVGEGTL